jgi:hypothetical protein
LKNLDGLSDHLQAFIGLKQELASVSSLEEYEDIVA